MRKTISLNYDWDFLPDFKEEFIGKELNNAEKVMIPHTMKEVPLNYFNELDYQFIGIYSKTITIEEELLKNNISIEFKAVMNLCNVFLNGELLLTHEGVYTLFIVDIT